MTSPPRRRSPEAARALIVEKAENLLRTRPASELTVAAVMRETGLTREAFYAYFRNRYELIAAVVGPLRERLDPSIEIWRSGRGTLEYDGRDALRGVAAVYAEDGALLRALAQASADDEEAARVWSEFTDPPVAAIAERLEREIRAGELRRFDVDGVVRVLVRMNLATFFAELVDESESDLEDVVERLLSIWLATIESYRTA